MERSALCGLNLQRNPFGSYAAYGCREPGQPDAAKRINRGRVLILVASTLTAASLLSGLAHAAIAVAAF